MPSVHRTGQLPRRASPTPSWLPMLLTAGVVAMTACAHSMASSGDTSPSPKGDMSLTPPNPDPRIGLKAGVWDAGQAAWNMNLVSNTRPV